MSDPRFLAIFSVVFILLGSYNVYLGLKRINQARARGQQIVWYKQINLLTGIEYILLSVVFLLSLRECIEQAIVTCSYPVSELTELLNILVQPAHQGLAIRQADVSIHLGITRCQARHITESR